MSNTARSYGHVAIFCGGQSSERDISLTSGKCVELALKSANISCSLLDTKLNVVPTILALNPTRAFIALHGGEGEDGTIQALLDLLKIPYTGSGAQASSLAIDKYRTKLVWRGSQLPTPDFCLIQDIHNLPSHYPFPCMVKANCQGSTIGTFWVSSHNELRTTIKKAMAYGQEVLLEKWIHGHEFSVSILNNRVLPPIRIVPSSGFYDYDAKYKATDTQYLLPCGLSESQEEHLKELAYQAFTVLGCTGWGRVDIMQDQKGQFWLIEVNTVPGLTEHSLVPKSAQAVGIDLPELMVSILNQTLKPFQKYSAPTPLQTSEVTQRVQSEISDL